MLGILRDLPALQHRIPDRHCPGWFRAAAVDAREFLALSAADVYVVPPDVPPSLAYWFGTTSRGQDVFWQ